MVHKLTLIIPAYNEAENIPNFLPLVIDFCTRNDFALIINDDGSNDDTYALIRKLLSGTAYTIIKNKVNKGYGGAIKEGILASLTDYSMIIDADGQHYLQDVEKLYAKILQTEADMVIGSRKGQPNGSFMRNIGKWLIRRFAKLLMPIHIYDLNSGMKIFRTDLAKKYIHLYPDTMAFSDIIALVFINNRHLVLEEPIRIKERKGGKSTIGLHTALQTVMEIINILALFNPMKIFFPISILLIVSGVLWSAKFFLNNVGVSVGGSLLITTGIIIFLIGLIAEQLSAIRKRV